MIKISPSILSADFANLERDIVRAESAGADYIHVDVMDGEFVPNITIGIPVTAAIRKVTCLPLDVHLMIGRPIRYVEQFCKAGADILTIHTEADSAENTLRAIELIRSAGVIPGITMKPGTPWQDALAFIELCGLALVMTVEPGFGGQGFMNEMMPKVKALRQFIDSHGLDCELEVDGGVNPETAKICIENGANVLVAGSAVFGAPDMAEIIRSLRGR